MGLDDPVPQPQGLGQQQFDRVQIGRVRRIRIDAVADAGGEELQVVQLAERVRLALASRDATFRRRPAVGAVVRGSGIPTGTFEPGRRGEQRVAGRGVDEAGMRDVGQVGGEQAAGPLDVGLPGPSGLRLEDPQVGHRISAGPPGPRRAVGR